MKHEPLNHLIRSLQQVADPADGAASDAQLLDRFVTWQDQAAFELLLWRHGPLVLGVCRRVLSSSHDAEDAFQATWLTFVRKARSIARGAALASWLYQVAYRVALRARAEAARRAQCEQGGVDELAGTPASTGGLDFQQVLDEEVNRLPARWRSAFVLCCLEGKTGEEAARQLGCPPGTVSSRLTRARQRLRSRLLRRGLTPTALAAVLVSDALAAPVPAALIVSTLKASLLFSNGKAAGGELSAHAVALTEGVLRAMFLAKLKIVAWLLLAVGLLAAAGTLARPPLWAASAETAQDRPTAPGEPKQDAKKPGPIAVRVVKPKQGGLARTLRETCLVSAAAQLEIFPIVAGVIKNVSVDLGDRVKKGQELAEIDAPNLVFEEKQAANAVQQARGQVRSAKARAAVARAEVEAAKAIVTQRQAEAESSKAVLVFRQRQLDRTKELLKNRIADALMIDEAEQQVATAKAQVAAADAAVANARADRIVKESKLEQSEADLEIANANLEAAEISLQKAQYVRGLAKILSPVDGVVTRLNSRVGQFLQAGNAGAQLPLLTVEQTDRVRVVTQVSSQDAPLTEPGAPVELSFKDLPGVHFTGYKVSRIGFALDPKDSTMRVEIDVPNPRQQLRPGMFGSATIRLPKGLPNVLRVPALSLLQESPGTYVLYVVRDGKAHRTPVELGTYTDEDVEIISGLKPEDLVVTNAKGLKGKGDVVPVEVKERLGSKE